MKLKYFFTVALLLAMAHRGLAYDFEVDGIYYVKTGDSFVEVTSSSDGFGHGNPDTPSSYTGDIVIPASIVVDGATYQVTAIGSAAFMGAKVQTVALPEGIHTIKTHAFNSSSVSHISLPTTLKVIEEYAFTAAQLTDIDLPEGLEEIGQNAFDGSGLLKVTIPSTVHTIGNMAFHLCGYDFKKWLSEGLQYINVAEGNKHYDSRGDCNAVVETATSTLVVASMATVIGDDITAIGRSAFQDLPIRILRLPADISSYGPQCFVGCTKLDTIYSYRQDPVATAMDVFQMMSVKPHAILFVPEGSKEKYAETPQWNIFDGEGQIREFSTLGINNTTTLNMSPTSLYDLSGKLIQRNKTTKSQRNKGVYITDDGRKILIK